MMDHYRAYYDLFVLNFSNKWKKSFDSKNCKIWKTVFKRSETSPKKILNLKTYEKKV